MRKSLKKEFQINKKEINELYEELVNLNFGITPPVPLLDQEIDNYIYPEVTSLLHSRLTELIASQNMPSQGISIERIRIQHIIDTMDSKPHSLFDHFYNYMNVFLLISFAFLPFWFDYLKGLISDVLWAYPLSIMFFIILFSFAKSFSETKSIDNQYQFRQGFKLLFYHLHLEILNTEYAHT